MKNSKITVKILIVFLFVSLLIIIAAVLSGRAAIKNYPVRGVDVSSYQGRIDWKVLAQNDIDFAFIKATEGSSHVDKTYKKNIEGAKETDIEISAYHFLSFESNGEAQAENFIATVDKQDITLPPVIDIELYGKYNNAPLDEKSVRTILDAMIQRIHQEYGKKPIIYTNHRTYSLYISGRYPDCDIWICDVAKKPTLPDGRKWTFWQYSHTEKLSGYKGEEKHIDMNVFYGTEEEFISYIKR